MRLIWLSALFFLTPVPLPAFATSIAQWDDIRVKHTWHTVPADWENLGHPSAGTTIDFDIALKSDRESAVIDALSEISDPNHPRYRAFLSKEQLDELVKPSQDSLQLVSAWLAHHDMPSSSVSTIYGGNWMTVTNVSLSQANQILGASYRLYRNTKTNETIIRTIGYSLPTVLHTHIQTVTPTTCFPTMQVTLQSPHRRPFGPAPAPAPAASGNLRTRIQPPLPPPIIVPAIVRTMYGTTEYEPAAVNGPHRNTLAVVGDRYPSWGDLTEFMLTYQAQSEDASFILARLNPDLPDADPTSSVTVQYTSAMIYPTILFYFGTKKDEVSLTRFLSHVLDRLAPIPTLSISYNYFTEPVVPSQLADTLCHQFARLGARGTSVLVGSGDHGVGDGTCRDGEGNIKFIAEFPSSCPWVTSVGATQFLDEEVAEGRSGGGFSTHHPRPSYQDRAVLDYFWELRDLNSGYYNASGRGYPDISAQGAGCAIVFNNNDDISRGTACSVAIVAGVFTLLNDFLISEGRKPLGFLNPWLYGAGRVALTDIRAGSNPGCGTPGFYAVEGWDPVTGLGTPNFRQLQDTIPPDSERPDFIPPPQPS